MNTKINLIVLTCVITVSATRSIFGRETPRLAGAARPPSPYEGNIIISDIRIRRIRKLYIMFYVPLAMSNTTLCAYETGARYHRRFQSGSRYIRRFIIIIYLSPDS